jgi:hypothetical protein
VDGDHKAARSGDGHRPLVVDRDRGRRLREVDVQSVTGGRLVDERVRAVVVLVTDAVDPALGGGRRLASERPGQADADGEES